MLLRLLHSSCQLSAAPAGAATPRAAHSIWLSPDFREWRITHRLAAIVAPILAIQGRDDAYGTLRQIEMLGEAGIQTEQLILDGVGHVPHDEARDAVIAAARDFIARL